MSHSSNITLNRVVQLTVRALLLIQERTFLLYVFFFFCCFVLLSRMCLHSTSWLILMSRAEPKKFDSSEIPAAKCTLTRCAYAKRKVTLVELKFHLLSVSATSETVAAAGSSSASNCSIQRSQLYSPRLYSLFFESECLSGISNLKLQLLSRFG